MTWLKRGLLVWPPTGLSWAASHAALPVLDQGDGPTTVYFSPRDGQGRAHVARAEVDLDGLRVVRYDQVPVLRPGPRGMFDDAGVTVSCLVRNGATLILYYSGWMLGSSVPFYFQVGSATSTDGGMTFLRGSAAPLLERNAVDPYLTASPYVMFDEGRWRMWYVSGTGWRDNDEPCYHIKYAESTDGFTWTREGRVCIDYEDESEHAISRPWVVRDVDRYRMWFASRGSSYRIGYAESQDGLTWERTAERGGLTVSPDGWDSEMLAYPCVFDHGAERLMLYNGNDYGRTGIGLAIQRPG